ncbi:DUF4436 domain-containing protein [Mycobacterium nebraskense]|uniref:DUF4436 domain-containing protein n=1 Tax=Mycobacterium nebraskense TaxID=244292 RepID=A0A1X1YVS8_9MYCO|nr:DUF4436 domain-containing protein [Mycobacterium nebraskense]KKC04920.1 membrane protein [Mycobacterium nebraskense]MBI2693555.1 DUF4436 domain-containing protein [Mycobacterium nebraskense]MCV7119899.1 DUF4436 domain-containing protein [Mycobacterium nebraskense]ORW15192.1 hypothetical protein AWC17_17220 [Mycobacterium nebraskense]
MTHHSPPAPPPPTPSEQPLATPPTRRGRRVAVGVGIVVAFLIVYGLSLFGVHFLAKSAGPLKPPDLNATNDTVVLVRLEKLDAVANRLTVKVLVIPEDSMFDKRLDVLKTDTAVRMDPANDLGDLQYPAGKSPAQVATTIEAHGDPNNWPFDSYSTDTMSAEVLVGQGDARQYIPARLEVTGALDGWDVSVKRVGEASQESDRPDNVIITLHRAKGPLIFDLGICLVLFALPTLAFAVAIQIALGRRKFVPPFVTWFAAMLFAVIPIRNFLPGSPPPGAWIDQALVIWVLIALVGAMGLYMVTWYRQSD